MKNLPRTDEEYNALLGRLIKGAEYLDSPIIKQKDFNDGLKLYDELERTVRHYRTGGKS